MKVLSDKTRLDVLSYIYLHPGCSGKELLVNQKVSQPTLSFHLARLEQIDIIKVKKVGQTHYYEINIKMARDFQATLRGWIGDKKN